MNKFMVLCFTVMLVGCATGGKVRDLNVGQDRASVERDLGRPDGYSQVDGYDVLTYKNRLMSAWSWDKADYQVILKDGRVVQYGPGEVRRANTGGGIVLVAPIK